MARPCRYPKDLTGIRFGRLVALEPTGYDRHGVMRWKCRCDCGAVHETSRSKLISGNTISCGCAVFREWTDEGRERLSATMKKVWTPERRAKLSQTIRAKYEARKAAVHDPER